MDIRQVLTEAGYWATGGYLDEIAQKWEEVGFSAQEVEAWLDSGCFSPEAARALANAGVTPNDAKTVVKERIGLGQYTSTLGYKVSNGDLSISDVLQLLKAKG